METSGLPEENIFLSKNQEGVSPTIHSQSQGAKQEKAR
eukprot:CAMPEP_0175165204 /NCGR_PEP_ID=MMETSP0087-20121206/26925_1 /TAXON_ID=136419 /ORGANISM="Unknown Unknown, Strain D1" /LENGTH=37 /DNA_ID= /DNA_START= /DNA_END= /DNA_ORIENTATION=